MQGIRIYEMPECKMVSSGIGMFGEEKFERFYKWFSSQKSSLFPKNFLLHEQNGFERDNSRAELGSVISSLGAQKIMGYAQMDYYTPVRAKR